MDFIGVFIQANVKHRVFVHFDSTYGEYFLEYDSYFKIPLSLKKSMYGMTNDGKLFADQINSFLIYEAGF